MLMTAGGEWVGASHGGCHRFVFSLLLREGTLQPGEYVILVDPTWNESANYDPQYKQVLIDLYSSCQTELQPVSQEDGVKVLGEALKGVAVSKVDESTRQYIYEEY